MPCSLLVATLLLASPITSPKEFFGHDVCEDYWLANYKQLTSYWQKLEEQSPRLRLQSIGKTEEGREQLMAIISDPRNLRDVERWRRTSERLARGKGLTEDEARRLAREGKAIVWIDGGLHATEVLGAQQLLQTAYDLVSREDEENRRILRDCVILLVHANPDGMDLVSDWYMRRPEPQTRALEGVPVLYQKYAGHDNNRDFYASNLQETRNMNRILYQSWYPQIVYNHHQSAPSGTIMFIPPFRNPFNYHVDPLAQVSIDLVGLQMHRRLIGLGLTGTVMRDGAPYSGWWNGGLRTTTYFHNMIGILTETWGSPNPTPAPWVKNRQIPTGDIPKPLDVRRWHLRDSLQYEVEANYAILDHASRYRERLLFDFYRMARNSIERGSRDHWTRYPSRIEAYGQEALSKPELRDARAYVIPSDQPRFDTATRFVRMLLHTGVEVSQLDKTVGKWPGGSFLVRCDQAFRPHVLDMFEMQDYPNNFQYPGGPPIAPYDMAGYTLAFQMGVQFERILDDPDSVGLHERLHLTLDDVSAPAPPPLARKPRIGLWDRYGGSMPSGWMRRLFEDFGFDYEVVFAPDLDFGRLREKFDVIVLVGGAVPARDAAADRRSSLSDDPTIPFYLRRRMGSITVQRTLPALREFVEKGGQIIAIGSSALNLSRHWNLPVASALVGDDGQPLPNTKFYIPGSVLRMRVVPGPLTEGLPGEIDVLFDNSPSFRITDASRAKPVGVFDTDKPLRSGWAWGQAALKDTVAIVDVPIGKGNVLLSGPELNFRCQSHAAFPILFNAILRE